MKKSQATLLGAILSLITLVLVACEEDLSVIWPPPPAQWPLPLAVVDSSSTAEASFDSLGPGPDVTISARITVRAESDSLQLVSYSLYAYGTILEDSIRQRNIRQGDVDSVRIVVSFERPRPVSRFAEVNVSLRYRSYRAGVFSTMFRTVTLRPELEWHGQSEPGLRPVNYDSRIQSTGRIIWSRNADGFYFEGRVASSQMVYFYSLSDSSILDVTPPSAAYGALDISHDNRYLLMADNTGAAANLYLYEIQSRQLRILLPAMPDMLIASGAFSANDNLIVFNTIKITPGSSEYPVWLFNRADSTLAGISTVNETSTTITSWFPNSNDRFAYHTHNTWIGLYSISTGRLSRVFFPYPNYPRFLLNDGFSVIGMRIDDARGGGVAESHVWVYNLLGEAVAQLTFLPEIVFDFSLSPDGRTLAFAGYRNGAWGLWILPTEGIMGSARVSIEPTR